MLRSYKGRNVEIGQKVACFWNLHEDVFSIEGKYFEREKNRKLIVSHGNELLLKNVTFSVNERLRQKVLEERQKNVHAYVKGEFVGEADFLATLREGAGMREAYYNPYNVSTFVDKETGEKLESAEMVLLVNKRVYYK